MPSTRFEHTVNSWRGYCTLAITVGAIAEVLEDPASLAFWQGESALERIDAPTGRSGLVVSGAFLLYLAVDMLVGVVCRHRFRRSMGAVYLHHVGCLVPTAYFILPSPPRGYFLYVWGEALTAVRVLHPVARWHARGVVFACRRVLWTYLLCRDLYLWEDTAEIFGGAAAMMPPCVCLLLLGLDVVWWREHARTGAEHRSSSGDAGSAGSGGEAEGDAAEREGSLLLPRTSEAGAADAAGPTPSGDYAIDVPSRSPGEGASCMGDEGDGDGAGGCAGSRRGGEDFGTDLLRTAPSVIGLDSL